ncbi:MAG: sigma factor-like helix-turn-helix DNA-binding protein [Alphaproteobacteria bacterium]
MSGAEIAEALDVSAEAVESLLARGRRTLRGLLAEHYKDIRGEARTLRGRTA